MQYTVITEDGNARHDSDDHARDLVAIASAAQDDFWDGHLDSRPVGIIETAVYEKIRAAAKAEVAQGNQR